MLYIRHAEKQYSNGNAEEFSLDPGLTSKGKDDARRRFQQLLDDYGPPEQVFCSPYLRTRETAQIACDVIFNQTGINVPIIYDSTLSEYLGHQKSKDIIQHLRPETLLLKPIPPETWKEYHNRLKSHIKTHQQSGWYITHGLVINSVAFFYGVQVSNIKELGAILIDKGQVTVI